MNTYYMAYAKANGDTRYWHEYADEKCGWNSRFKKNAMIFTEAQMQEPGFDEKWKDFDGDWEDRTVSEDHPPIRDGLNFLVRIGIDFSETDNFEAAIALTRQCPD